MVTRGMSRCHPPCSRTSMWEEVEEQGYLGAHSALLLVDLHQSDALKNRGSLLKTKQSCMNKQKSYN